MNNTFPQSILAALALFLGGAVFAQNNIVDGGSNNLGNGVSHTQAVGADNDPYRDGTSGANFGVADRNVVIGQRAATRADSQSDGNVVIGGGAGQNMATAANSNVIIGEYAASAGLTDLGGGVFGPPYLRDMTADGLVIIGQFAGQNVTSGADNVFIGEQAGREVTLDSDHTVIGSRAGVRMGLGSTASDNTLIGEEAGVSLLGGDRNVFVGENAGASIDEGSDNVAIGRDAIAENYSGSGFKDPNASYDNVAIGTEAGNTIGYGVATPDAPVFNSVFVGSGAGQDVGVGTVNTFVGAGAGFNTEHSDLNTFIGAGAGWDNNRTNNQNDGLRNTYVGTGAGFFNREGNDNVAIGAVADFASWENNDHAELVSSFASGIQGFSPVDPFVVRSSTDHELHRTVNIGSYASAQHDDAINIGYSALTQQLRGITIGSNANNTHEDAIVIGFEAQSHGADIAVIGNDDTISIDPHADDSTALGSTAFRYSDVHARTYSVDGNTSGSAIIDLNADAAEDNDDRWRIEAADSGLFSIQTFVDGFYNPVVTIDNAGNAVVVGEISVNSDARLKRDIADMEDPMAVLNTLQPKTYKWKPYLEKGDATQFGFLAQDVEKVLPQLVSSDTEGIKSVNYQELVPVLVKALQDQDAKLKEQQKLIDELRARAALKQDIQDQLTELKILVEDNADRIKDHEHEE